MNQYYPYKQNPYHGGAGPMQPAVAPQYQYPQYPQAGFIPPTGGGGAPGTVGGAGMLPMEQSYIENILRLNRGKLATVHATFEGNREWNAKTWTGIIEAAGRDHLILSDPETGQRLLLPMVYLDYVTFTEEIEYEPSFGGTGGLATFPPR
ncbi:spore coat protein GerQ [Niallia sp. XMNu-256]|uniref:spore coat protein GerQ n=1 Tax=Niallia sp. XMNu-256 TaxID=3082444 RepID=UPI0030CB96DE